MHYAVWGLVKGGPNNNSRRRPAEGALAYHL
jgi:hypothetical protein